jgi:hypothetical protein
MMSAIAEMAGLLESFKPAAPSIIAAAAKSKAGQLRAQLLQHGPLRASELAKAVELKDSGDVMALLKRDLQIGRVTKKDGLYALNPAFEQPPRSRMLTPMEELITWIPVQESLPDDDSTVLVSLAEDDEPVWLGHHSAGAWHDIEGRRRADVTHWAQVPAGRAGWRHG